MYQKTHCNWNRSTHGKFNNWNRRTRPINRYGAFIQQLEKEKERDEKATAYWAEITPILQNFREDLRTLGKPPSVHATKENILYCVAIFDIISKCQDSLEGGIRIAPKKLEQLVTEFNNDLFYAGRHTPFDRKKDSIYGDLPYWNTTEVGEQITVENIQFGPELGFPRKPASYWLSLSKKKKTTVTAVQEFKKGCIKKSQPMWVTEALVKTEIHKFIQAAYKIFTAELEEILENS